MTWLCPLCRLWRLVDTTASDHAEEAVTELRATRVVFTLKVLLSN